MDLLLTLLQLALVFGLAYAFTIKGVPWLVVTIGRRLGFKMQLLPVTHKRLARFKRIKRGYYSFLAITTLFVASLFLELLVNSKPLVIHYGDKTSFPAVSQWFDKITPWTISSHLKKAEFGQVGRGPVDYALFARTCEDASALPFQLELLQAKLQKEEAKFAKLKAPGTDAKPFQIKDYANKKRRVDHKRQEAELVEKSVAIFAAGQTWIMQTIYPFSPDDFRYDLPVRPPNKPSLHGRAVDSIEDADGVVLFSGAILTETDDEIRIRDAAGELHTVAKKPDQKVIRAHHAIPLGTGTSGRDVVPMITYGFRISLAFALMVAFLGYCIGITIGAIQGYYGGWVDIITQRVQEIWGSIPFLLTIMIIASLIKPDFWVLVFLLVTLRSWLGITFYIRGEFYREKAKDYVQSAIGSGVSDWKIMLGHILPNSLVPIVTYAPFAIVGYIGLLVSLDYLGFGLPTGTPSWGALLRQGLERVSFDPHLTIVPVICLCLTLYSVVMIGEAVREAFDPKVFSRLR